MKKLLFSLIFAANIFGNQPSALIAPYSDSHKARLLEIAFEDPYSFFVGSAIVRKGFVTAQAFETESRKEMEKVLDDGLRIKNVIFNTEKPVGFIVFFKSKEMSLESLKKTIEAQGFPFDEQQIITAMPYLKKTDAECAEFAKIEAVAISQSFQRKGYARALIKDAIATIKKMWPHLKKIELDVNSDNNTARKLYESEDFIISPVQPAHLPMIDAVQYEKAL